MKKEEKNGFSVAKCKKGGSSEHHVQRSIIPVTAVWPLGSAISRSLMTIARAASEDWGCGNWMMGVCRRQEGNSARIRHLRRLWLLREREVIRRGDRQQREYLHWEIPESVKSG